MNDILLEIENAKVSSRGILRFESLNFKWEQGQNWAVVASSGATLTAFLETLRGNTVVSHGNIKRPFAALYLEEKSEAGEVHSFRDLIAYVSQKYEFRNRSNLQNFYFQQRFNSSESEEAATVLELLSQIKPKVAGPWNLEKVANLLRLDHLLEKSILKLSNGETRRLALALGLMQQPTIYLMDQPMTGLDAQSRKEFGDVLNSITAQGVHVLMTASATEIPEGLSHIAKIEGLGKVELFSRKEFLKTDASDLKRKTFDWKLLEKLVPKNLKSGHEVILLDQVTIRYGDKILLDSVSWKVNSGERWQLKGKNGSGKSTLISLLIGENPQAYAQNLWLFGRKRGTGESIWDIKRPTGFVAPELSRFFPANQTCRKVILSGLFDTIGLFRKVTPDQEKLAKLWLNLFELDQVSELPLNRLSLEHQRWTLLARALIKKPKLLILDEASQGMDEFQRVIFKDTVQQICELSQITLIYVSHYAEDVPEAVNQVFELD